MQWNVYRYSWLVLLYKSPPQAFKVKCKNCSDFLRKESYMFSIQLQLWSNFNRKVFNGPTFHNQNIHDNSLCFNKARMNCKNNFICGHLFLHLKPKHSLEKKSRHVTVIVELCLIWRHFRRSHYDCDHWIKEREERELWLWITTTLTETLLNLHFHWTVQGWLWVC